MDRRAGLLYTHEYFRYSDTIELLNLHAGSYHRWDWKKVARLGKLAAPAVAGQLAVGLQGAGLVYTSGAVLLHGSAMRWNADS